MNNLTKSVKVVNQFIGLLLGDKLTVAAEHALEQHPDLRFIA
jgi:hypothetical protein